jgi:hypothetical protein
VPGACSSGLGFRLVREVEQEKMMRRIFPEPVAAIVSLSE